MSEETETPPRKICEIYLRRTNCLAAYLAFHRDTSRSQQIMNGVVCLVLAALCGTGVVWRLFFGLQSDLPYFAVWLSLSAVFFALVGWVQVWPPRVALREAVARWQYERQLRQPIEIFEHDEGLLILAGQTPELYRWTWYLNVKVLRRGRLWAAESIYDVTYISRDDFPTQEAFDEFVEWATSQWKNRSAGRAFEVLPAKKARGEAE